MFAFAVCVALLMIHQGECAMKATAVLYRDNTMNSSGTLTFTQNDANSPVRITGTISGLNVNSAHGFHVHVSPVSDGSPNCTAAGAHFNPYNVTHGPKTANIMNRHVGDLGNLTTNANGVVELNMDDSIIQLYNATQSIMGRTVIVHMMRDDGGMGGSIDSNTTGNAGARIICGLIKSNALKMTPTMFVLFTTMLIFMVKLF